MTKRSLVVWFRVPAYIFFTVVQPVMFVLLFRYVFGGAIQVPVPGGYVNWLIPGIIGTNSRFRILQHCHRACRGNCSAAGSTG